MPDPSEEEPPAAPPADPVAPAPPAASAASAPSARDVPTFIAVVAIVVVSLVVGMTAYSVQLATARRVAASSVASAEIPPRDPRVDARDEAEGVRARDGSRFVAGDTLALDARLGHASLGRGARGETFLLAQLVASDDVRATVPMNLALVIDRSGSMKGDRIAHATAAAVGSLARLREGDSVTVVSFAGTAQVVVAPTRVTAWNRGAIEDAVRTIRVSGETCISCGLDEAMQQLAATPLSGDRVSRLILLSDGAANSGVSDVPGLRAMAARMARRGVSLSTVGVDVDFDEKVMAALAAEGNGRHYFVENAAGLEAVFRREFDDVLASVAKDAELTIELAPGVTTEELFDRSFRREGSRLVVPLGAFRSGQEKTALLRLRVPTEREGVVPVARLEVTYRDLAARADASAGGRLSASVRGDGREQKELDPFVAARVERSRTASTLVEANRLFEAGLEREGRAKLATRRVEIENVEGVALASAKASPAAAPRRAAKSIDRDFADQLGALSAAAPAATAPSPGPGSRQGRAQIRLNQQSAFDLGY